MMKRTTYPPATFDVCRGGFVLFYVMGMLALLTLGALIASSSARLESRTSRNHLESVRALYHAEAGVKLVKGEVEEGLEEGRTLREVLSELRVEAPDRIDFEEIAEFDEMVPERLFGFESLGRSGDARTGVMAQFRRQPLLPAGLFGDVKLESKPNVRIYGYDSRRVVEPGPEDSNGGGSVGSNGLVDLGNHQVLDGNILLGETEDGLVADCNRCDSFVQVEVGALDPDPLGLLDGAMAEEFALVQSVNDNHLVDGLVGTRLLVPKDVELTLTAGDYYFTQVDIMNDGKLTIDDSEGAVRVFLGGEFWMHPHADLVVTSGLPFGFQLYSNSTETIRLQPSNDLTAFVYAPVASLRLQPGNDVLGAFWANQVRVQPGGTIYLDTSLMERFLSNQLELHAWYEHHGN